MEKKILFIYTSYSTFVKKDYEILSSNHLVQKYQFKPVKGLFKTAVQLLLQFIYLSINFWKFDGVFIWFADTHSFIPVILSKLFGKKSYVIIGGFDAVALPELKYGLFESNYLRKFFGRLSIRYSSFVLPVDKSLIESTNSYASSEKIGLPVGVKKFVRNIRGKVITIPTGYDPKFWKENSNIVRTNSVVTVAYIPDWTRWRLKGCDLILEISNILTDYNFYIYGITAEFEDVLKAKMNIPDNLHLIRFVDSNKLPDIYSRHKVYAQFSLSEGLPNVLCESILCGCIPVGSKVNGITTAIKDKQLILSYKNPDSAAKIIEKAMNFSKDQTLTYYNHIFNNFQESKRKKSILKLITD